MAPPPLSPSHLIMTSCISLLFLLCVQPTSIATGVCRRPRLAPYLLATASGVFWFPYFPLSHSLLVITLLTRSDLSGCDVIGQLKTTGVGSEADSQATTTNNDRPKPSPYACRCGVSWLVRWSPTYPPAKRPGFLGGAWGLWLDWL